MCCPPEIAEDLWPHVKGFLEQAAQHSGGWTLGALEASVVDGAGLLWVITRDDAIVAALITQLTENKKREKICDIVACGGRDFQSWRHLMPEIEQYAKDSGCVVLMFGGRRGWGRAFPDFHETVTIFEKRL